MGNETITKEDAKVKIDRLCTEVSRLPVCPNSLTFVDLYHRVLELYALEEYWLAFSIANILILGLKESVSYSFL